MDVLFAGPSALEIIRLVRQNPELALIPANNFNPATLNGPRGSASKLNFCALGLSAQPTKAHPAFLRVSSKPHRKRVDNVCCLVLPKGLPAGSILQLVRSPSNASSRFKNNSRTASNRPLGINTQVASNRPLANQTVEPDDLLDDFDGHRVFVECIPLACATVAARYQRLMHQGKMTESCAVVQLVELVMEFTGQYSRNPGDPRNGSITTELPSATNTAEIRHFIQESHHVLGTGLLSKALPYARDGSRSAMETCLWIMTTLPERYGFYAFKEVELNVSLVVTSAQRALMQHKTLTPDLLWKRANVAIEYQGYLEHLSRASRAEDNRRMSDYSICGITVMFVTFDDVKTIAAFDRLAMRVAKEIDLHVMSSGQAKRIESLLNNQQARAERMRHLARLLPPVNR